MFTELCDAEGAVNDSAQNKLASFSYTWLAFYYDRQLYVDDADGDIIIPDNLRFLHILYDEV